MNTLISTRSLAGAIYDIPLRNAVETGAFPRLHFIIHDCFSPEEI